MAFSYSAVSVAARITVLASSFLVACASGPAYPPIEDKAQPSEPAPVSEFVTAHGSQLFVDGDEFSFRAVNFSNGYEEPGHDIAAGRHHTEADFERVQRLGFNSIRFAFNGHWFERDRTGFFTWLDANIESARAHDLRLILDLHVPIGGYWLDPTSEELDFSLWTDPALKARNIALWQAIAERYRDEPVVAAYDLLNEPVTTDEDGSQWQLFAEQLTAAIREVDPQHLIVVQRLYGLSGRYGTRGQSAQFVINDANVLYDSHIYDPTQHAQAGVRWGAAKVANIGLYPDENALIPTGVHELDVEARIRSERVEAGTSEWRRYSSPWVEAKGRKLVAAAPQAAIEGALSGVVYFDDVRVFERDQAGVEREIISDPISEDTIAGWHDWQSKTARSIITADRRSASGSNDNASLTLQLRGTGLNTIAGWSNNDHWFRVIPGHSYRIEGAMRGEDVRYISGASVAQAGFELNFFKPHHSSDVPVFHARNKEYINYTLEPLVAFGQRHAVPVSVLETGLATSAFGPSGSGGELWLKDLLSEIEASTSGYGLWNYHGELAGIYTTHHLSPVGQPNRALIDTLLQAQTGRTLSASIAKE